MGLATLAYAVPLPHHTLFFDVSAEEAHRRGQSTSRAVVDRLDAEDLAFYGRVREGYMRLMRDRPDRFTRIDSSGPPEDTERRVLEALGELLELGG